MMMISILSFSPRRAVMRIFACCQNFHHALSKMMPMEKYGSRMNKGDEEGVTLVRYWGRRGRFFLTRQQFLLLLFCAEMPFCRNIHNRNAFLGRVTFLCSSIESCKKNKKTKSRIFNCSSPLFCIRSKEQHLESESSMYILQPTPWLADLMMAGVKKIFARSDVPSDNLADQKIYPDAITSGSA